MTTVQTPGIRYRQGSRDMVVTVMDPESLIKSLEETTKWNPVRTTAGGGAGGQRNPDPAHRKGIANYLENEPDFILGSIVLYVTPREASFTPDSQQPAHNAGEPGTLFFKLGTQFFVGDGMHRAGGYRDVFEKFEEDKDNKVMERLRTSGQPLIIVIDEDPVRRGQDFADLATTKPMTKSTGYSMDRRQPLNRLVLGLVTNPDLKIFGAEASRVEFLRDTPGALSAKMFSYKTVRFVSGLILGAPLATGKTWEKTANDLALADNANSILVEFWSGLSSVSAYRDISEGGKKAKIPEVRKETYLLSSGLLHAIAWGVRLAQEKGVAMTAYFTALDEKVDFRRPRGGVKPTEADPLRRHETIFAGTLVDPKTGTIQGNKDAWVATAQQLASIAASE